MYIGKLIMWLLVVVVIG